MRMYSPRFLDLYLMQVGEKLDQTEVGEDLIPGIDIKDSVECRTINKRNTNTVPC